MFFASFADTVWQIVLSQGVLFGIGGVMLNFVHVSIFSEWFENKKSKAMAIIWLGWGVGSLAFPVVLWGFVKTRFGLFAYALVFGLANGGYTNCMMPFFAEIAGSDGALFTTVHSLFSFLRGFAILSVGPVGVHLLRLGGEVAADSYAIGKYKYLVAYASGMTFASGALTLFSIHFWKPPK
ncbi:hypothetical protein H2201_001446 [Coniosporium apollinis]|uniref:Major facilitator superfamily (MFS) profile domain-containing protein n=1 Tax=Coniosporium apollinis TaxID=61459 RepID=A0ABQ9P2B8_9PEZI|nr:hypothetical protein H2201_001446 [Coniosporium apollinis]